MKLLRKRPAIEDSKYRADRDPVNVWDGEKFVFTLRKISSIVKDFPIPPAFEDKIYAYRRLDPWSPFRSIGSEPFSCYISYRI